MEGIFWCFSLIHCITLSVLVFNCSTNPSKAEEVWQAASADETVMQLSIMALVICSKSYQTMIANKNNISKTFRLYLIGYALRSIMKHYPNMKVMNRVIMKKMFCKQRISLWSVGCVIESLTCF